MCHICATRQVRDELLRQIQANKEAAEAASTQMEAQHETELQRRVAECADEGKRQHSTLLRRMVVRRMCSQGLARGFSTWLETYQTHTHRRRLLLHASANLGKPGLLSAFAWWHGDWETTSRDAEVSALESAWEDEAKERSLYVFMNACMHMWEHAHVGG